MGGVASPFFTLRELPRSFLEEKRKESIENYEAACSSYLILFFGFGKDLLCYYISRFNTSFLK